MCATTDERMTAARKSTRCSCRATSGRVESTSSPFGVCNRTNIANVDSINLTAPSRARTLSVTKPVIPADIAANFVRMEAEKSKVRRDGAR